MSKVTAADYFRDNGYVLLDNALGSDLCKSLTEHMFKLYEEGKMVEDAQCPVSQSIYGDVVFDNLLEKLAEPIGNQLGLELLPTYTYARIYRNGEELKRHTDRPACEISGTLTLGFDGLNVWPIYFSADPNDERGKRVDLKIGDILMYRGEDLVHWRKPFKGEWQCQVFFHYVDANGPHREQAFDGRDSLGTPASQRKAEKESTEEVKQEEKPTAKLQKDPNDIQLPTIQQTRDGVFPIYGGVMIPSWDLQIPGMATFRKDTHPNLVFSPEECQQIIDLASTMYEEEGSVGAGKSGRVQKEIRNVDLYQVPLTESTRWVFDKIARSVSVANNEYFDYEIMGITHELQLLHYKAGQDPGHYEWHMDIGGMTSSTRKISVSVQLSNPTTYKGGQLIINNNGEIMNATVERGALTMFPSYCMHKVTKMEEGERWALVIWVHGSRRFR